jgi:hypothetical protein
VAGVDGTEADLDVELRAIAAPTHEIESRAHAARFRGVSEVGAMASMLSAQAFGNEDFNLLAAQFAVGIGEERLGLGVDLEDRASTVDGYDGIGDRFQELAG